MDEIMQNANRKMQNVKIECETRSFLTEEKYKELLGFFKNNSDFLGFQNQETYYFDCPQDLRIQLNDNYSKVWLKKGRIHDENREEIEIHFDKKDFKRLENLFLTLGYKVEIKWYRTRNSFKWRGIEVSLDYTKGYGHIIELEKMSTEENKQRDLEELNNLIKELEIEVSSREEFDEKYKYYKENWRELVI